MYQSIIDEGISIRILSSTAWQDLGSPNIVSTNSQMSTLNIITSHPLGNIP